MSMLRRKTNRIFDLSKTVEKPMLQQLVSDGLKAPSSCNLHLLKIIYLDKTDMDQLAKNCSRKFNWANSGVLIFVDTAINYERYAQIISAGMFVQNFLLGAEKCGISTIPIAGFTNDKFIHKHYGVEKRFKCVLSILVGYSLQTRTTPQPIKKIESEVDFYNNPFSISTNYKIDKWEFNQEERLYLRQIRSLYLFQGKLVFLRSKDQQDRYHHILMKLLEEFKTLSAVGVKNNDSAVFNDTECNEYFEFDDREANTQIILPTAVFLKKIKLVAGESIIIFHPKKFGLTALYCLLRGVINRDVYHRYLFFRFGAIGVKEIYRCESELKKNYTVSKIGGFKFTPFLPASGWKGKALNLLFNVIGDFEILKFEKRNSR